MSIVGSRPCSRPWRGPAWDPRRLQRGAAGVRARLCGFSARSEAGSSSSARRAVRILPHETTSLSSQIHNCSIHRIGSFARSLTVSPIVLLLLSLSTSSQPHWKGKHSFSRSANGAPLTRQLLEKALRAAFVSLGMPVPHYEWCAA